MLILKSLKKLKLLLQLKTYLWIAASANIKTGPAKSELTEESFLTGENVEITLS